MLFSRLRPSPSFTLLELLLVLGILGILGGITFVVLNPQELIAEARDSTRLANLRTVNQALFTYTTQMGDPGGNPDFIYISLPDATITCDTFLPTLPTLPIPYEYRCSTSVNYRKTDGTGWIPVALTSMPGGSPIPNLPIDPENNSSFFYSYISGGSYELTSLLESEKYLKSSASEDKGSDPGRLELGTDLSLWTPASGLVGYWGFDGSGSIANGQTIGLEDKSGSGNNGTASNLNSTGMSFVEGKVGNALQLDGTDDWVNAGTNAIVNFTGPLTMAVWFNTPDAGGTSRILSKQYSDTGETTSSSCYQLGIYENQYRLSLYTSAGSVDRQTGTTTSNVWVHFAGTWDGSQYRMYLNGSQIYSGSLSGVLKTNLLTPLSIGVSYADEAMYFFEGALDEARMYNRALSAPEIAALYKFAR
jgi:type II secretory pathway pseudopilin PulG